jgi:Ca2+-binding RTX toxin-like protein
VFIGADGRLRQTSGQRVFGGDGTDFLYVWVAKTIFDAGYQDQYLLQGEEMHGGAGVDWLWGNLRQDVLLGDSGNDYLHGDLLSGPRYAESERADLDGANDVEIGGTGEDQIYGGGGNDTLWGHADTDWLEGQNGDDTIYGGGGIDMIVADVSALYAPDAIDVIDGHFRNAPDEVVADDNAVDILLVIGQPIIADRIIVGQTAASRSDGKPQGQIHIDYNDRDLFLPWRAAPSADYPLGQPLVEQIRIGGLSGDDRIEFRRIGGLDNGGQPVEPLDIGDLVSRTNEYVGVIDGNSGNDILLGTEGRDRLDGGEGDDVMYGFGGDDRLWGDSTFGGDDTDHDVMFGGQGNDDMVGGLGTNEMFAWSRDPDPTVTQLRFMGGTTATGTDTTPASIKGFAPGPVNGRLRADMHFALSVNGAPAVNVTVTEAQAANNTTLQNLIDDLNNSLDAAGLGAQVDAAIDAGFVVFRTVANGGSLALELRQFGVFVSSLRDDNGDLDGDGFLDVDGVSEPFPLEDTGLDRMLGSEKHDELYGGTGLAFMFGNGAPVADPDRLWRSNGTLFESLDGGLLGDEWKQFAKESGLVWYVGATDADDIITVDYVTEAGFLRDHHLVTRLTNNGGNFSFAAQVRLDFNATDAEGNPLWNPEDVLLDIQEFQARGAVDPDPEGGALPPPEVIDDFEFEQRELEELILPPEADFEVILIDALDGNDQIYVGPTVQRTMWIDAGGGDDKVVISSGNAILVDKAELGKRNDLPTFATVIADDPSAAAPVLTDSRTLEGLTIDNPTDVDWFRFTLPAAAPADAEIRLASASDLDGLALELYSVGPDGALNLADEAVVEFSQDATEAAHDTPATAYELKDENSVYSVSRIRGLSIHEVGDEDFFSFELTDAGEENDRLGLLKFAEGDELHMQLLDEDGNEIEGYADEELAELVRTLSLNGLAPGKYILKVFSQSGPARYELVPQVGIPVPQTAEESDRDYVATLMLDLSGKQESLLDIGALAAGEYLLKVSSPRSVPTEYDLTIKIDNNPPVVEKFTTRTEVVRRDVILGGSGDDVLIGGMGEDWILAQAGNDVLSGGYDRQAEDLLIGGDGDDTFQILPDELPFLKKTTETYIPPTVNVLHSDTNDDRILYWGGDFDNLGRPVPDDVAIRWNRFLHRYEFTALVWDTAN